jgi:hypothetical protein
MEIRILSNIYLELSLEPKKETKARKMPSGWPWKAGTLFRAGLERNEGAENPENLGGFISVRRGGPEGFPRPSKERTL